MHSGIIFNIQKYSVHDGPGIRTILFLKGCPLRCQWCSNPESQALRPEPGYSVGKCLRCGRCAGACPAGALSLHAVDEGMRVNRECCRACSTLSCTDVCPAGAMVRYGNAMSVTEAVDAVERDAVFYARSGGGLTLSGGEPFMQGEFALALLREARKRYIHRAAETCGAAEEELFLEGCGLLNYLLFDVKHMDSHAHKAGTGAGNETPLRNVRQARARYPRLHIHIRTPLIPGFNDNENAVREMARFARELGAQDYELLPYHRMGSQKYHYLGRQYALEDRSLAAEAAAALQSAAESSFRDA